MMMWCKYFVEAQGYTIESNVLYQDNKSTIPLAKNGRMSAGKNSKHIQHRYFLVTDKIAQGDLDVKWAPTKEMWADINTKPLQGQLFREMRANIMGVAVDYDDEEERKRTHPKLLPPPKPEGVISRSDAKVLTQALTPNTEASVKRSTQQRAKAPVGRRSVLDDMKHGPGSRPVWADVGATRFPALTKSFAKAVLGPLG